MAKRIKYHCTHCGRDFEGEDREIVECPGCFWSTSVQRAGEKSSEVSPAKEVRSVPAKKQLPPAEKGKPLSAGLMRAAAGLAAVFVLAAAVYFSFSRGWLKMPEKGVSILPLQDPDQTGPASREKAAQETGVWTPEMKQVLAQRVDDKAGTLLTKPEREVLERSIPFKTGFVRKLPSAAWGFENFKEMLEEQQQAYKLQFPRSYRKKLEEHFQATYLPAVNSFQSGNLYDARNQWVESLAFPRYSADIRKHRGVALTMLRPLITDTLSKIGALNAMLVEERFRGEEEQIYQGYIETLELLKTGQWRESLEKIEVVERKISELEKAIANESGAPEYPQPIIAAVDTDIQKTLYDLLSIPNPAIADFEPMESDLGQKKVLAESQVPENLEEQLSFYRNAMRSIESEKWDDARTELGKILFPLSLVEDAQKKIKVLEQIEQQKLDSNSK